MNQPEVTYNTLPAAVQRLQEQLDRIEKKLNLLLRDESEKEDGEFIFVEEAATMLGVTKMTMYNKVSQRQIPAYKFGRRLQFKRKDIIELLEGTRRMTATEYDAKIKQEAQELLRDAVSRSVRKRSRRVIP